MISVRSLLNPFFTCFWDRPAVIWNPSGWRLVFFRNIILCMKEASFPSWMVAEPSDDSHTRLEISFPRCSSLPGGRLDISTNPIFEIQFWNQLHHLGTKYSFGACVPMYTFETILVMAVFTIHFSWNFEGRTVIIDKNYWHFFSVFDLPLVPFLYSKLPRLYRPEFSHLILPPHRTSHIVSPGR